MVQSMEEKLELAVGPFGLFEVPTLPKLIMMTGGEHCRVSETAVDGNTD